MVWVMRTCRWFRLARTYASREGDMSVVNISRYSSVS